MITQSMWEIKKKSGMNREKKVENQKKNKLFANLNYLNLL